MYIENFQANKRYQLFLAIRDNVLFSAGIFQFMKKI